MRTLVTGGAGFIGSHLVGHLLEAGDKVTVLDNFSTGRASNLAQHHGDPRLRVIEGTVLDRATLALLVGQADRVFHLAAAVGVRLIVDEPLAGLRTNIHGTEYVLDACMDAGARLLITSTSEVYGKNTADRLSEDSDRILGDSQLARWTYAAAKGIDEAFAHAYWSELGLSVTTVRLFNTVGPRQTGRYGMVVPTLVGQALRGEPLTVFGTGRQTRCFSYVGDIVPALVAIEESREARGQIYNLGGADEVSIDDLAERVLRITGSSSPIVHISYDRAYGPGFEDMQRRVPDNARAHALVGFAPRTGIDQIIAHVARSMGGRAGALAGPRRAAAQE